jgi:predicted double-glycine peptidase
MTLKNKYLEVPPFRQEKNYTCGCACVNSLLGFYGEETHSEEDMCDLIDATVKYGTSYKSIASFFKNEGYHVFYKQDLTIEDIKRFLDHEHPVLVAFQAWSEQKDVDYENKWNSGHYALILGYSDDNFYFMDPSLKDSLGYLPIEDFVSRWHDTDGEDDEELVHFGMLIMGPKPKAEIKRIRKKNFKRMG